jgi:hypothetical protein
MGHARVAIPARPVPQDAPLVLLGEVVCCCHDPGMQPRGPPGRDEEIAGEARSEMQVFLRSSGAHGDFIEAHIPKGDPRLWHVR